MKTKLTTLHILLIAGMLSAASCNNTQNENAKEIADSVAAKTDTVVQDIKEGATKMADKVDEALKSNPDSTFVVKASLDNAMEIRLLQAGIDNGTDKGLKAHAKMMLADHKKLGAGVKAYSDKKGYILMDGDNGKADDELATLSKKNKGMDWDKEWVEALTSGHNSAIDLFEKAKENVKDPELKNMVTGALPTLHAHLDMMLQLHDKLGK